MTKKIKVLEFITKGMLMLKKKKNTKTYEEGLSTSRFP